MIDVARPSGDSDGSEANALDVRGVSHAYGAKAALSDVTFCVRAASFTVLLGPNGAGKTTLFSLITRLFNTRRGEIRIFGHDISRSSSEALRRLGTVFQARTLDLDLTLRQNLSYHAALHGIGAEEASGRIATLLDAMELRGRMDDKARDLSGGQMRRVEIARALLHRPRLLLLDEATVGLDVQSRGAIEAIIRELVARERIGVLWATHLIDEVGPNDDIVVLHQGRCVMQGVPADILRKTGAQTMKDAFLRLTQAEAAEAAA
jgi:ABC-2 type transport system ATP-binding protein